MLAARFVCGGLAVWAVAFVRRVNVPLRSGMTGAVLLAGASYAATTWLFIASLRHIPAPTASLISYTYPAIVALVMILFRGERFTPRLGLILAVAIAGVALVARAPLARVGGLGAGLALASAATFAIYVVASGAIRDAGAPLAVSALVLTVAFCSWQAPR